jgi:hypothetical protein
MLLGYKPPNFARFKLSANGYLECSHFKKDTLEFDKILALRISNLKPTDKESTLVFAGLHIYIFLERIISRDILACDH